MTSRILAMVVALSVAPLLAAPAQAGTASYDDRGFVEQTAPRNTRTPKYVPRGAVPVESGCRGYGGRVTEGVNLFFCPGFLPGLIRVEETDGKQKLVKVRLIPCDSPDLARATEGSALAEANMLFCAEE
jgi:hypothetical protein